MKYGRMGTLKRGILPKAAAAGVVLLCLLSGAGCHGSMPESKPVQAIEAAVEAVAPAVSLPQHYLPPQDVDYSLYEKPAVVAKGIYVSQAVANSADIFPKRLDICNTTEVNAMVVDIKESDGLVTFNGISQADNLGLSINMIKDIRSFLQTLKENGVYRIGRIVVFKDNAIVEHYPDFGLRLADGTIFREKTSEGYGPAWLNPYNRDVWDYVLGIAKGAAELGFDEIQFDYFRFPTSPKIADAQFGDTGGLSKKEIITAFAQYAMEQLKPYGVKVSVDVYGTIILSDLDSGIIGQDYDSLCQIFDYVCPMLYPSHFAPDTMEIDYPDLHPYDTIYKSLVHSNERLAKVPDVRAVIRPWLQDFTASYLKYSNIPWQEYNAPQVREQIQAVYDAGLAQWLLWSSGGYNTVEALLPE